MTIRRKLSLVLTWSVSVMAIVVFAASPVQAKDTLKLGFSISLTGVYSQAAVSQINAYKVWKEQVNENGGIYVESLGKKLPIEFVYYDDKSSPQTAVKVYEKLITRDQVDLVLTPWGTTIHFAVAPLAEKYKMPMVGTTAASVKLREIQSQYFWFITAALPDRQMKALAGLLSHLGVRDVAVIYVQDLFPRENLRFLLPELEDAGIEAKLVKDYPMGAKDLTGLLSNVKSKDPGALIVLSYPADSFLITNQIKGVQYNPPFLFELVGPSIAAFGQAFGKASEGIATMGHWSPKGPWPGAEEFEARYIDMWGSRPDYLDSALAYMGCQIVKQAIEKAGSLDRKEIRDEIARSEFTTINGPVAFSGTENKLTPSMILQYQQGDLEIVWPESVSTANPLYPKPDWPK